MASQSSSPSDPDEDPRISKDLFDWCAAALGLAVLSPLMLVIAVLVRLTSPGPVFYRQVRTGKNNLPFLIYKFRSMRADAEKNGAQWAQRNDPRVTPLGSFLRRTHLDEIPQLINVLKGEMSLVGPRPERPIFVSKLSEQIEGYPLRLKVKPGITGLAQVCHKYDESIEDVKVKLKYDLHYIEQQGFLYDLKIIWNTGLNLLTGKTYDVGAPHRRKSGPILSRRFSMFKNKEGSNDPSFHWVAAATCIACGICG